ncbi:hypothetical protein EPUL_001801 [Erysiphe pulchra]|uniref:Uncharacterized protein n=1 Tax=Erysiphe pulchra TaxID=225359 RepID=A0A2S4PZX6_9PEZI|nr:hypothetical protein EPUL_001801 [Erysiphe pulchra]
MPSRDVACPFGSRENENGRDVSESLDPSRRVQKDVNNSGQAQPLAATVIHSIAKFTVAVEKIAAVQDTQVVASLPVKRLVPTMDLGEEREMDSEPEIDDSPSLEFSNFRKRTAGVLHTD